MLIGCSMLACKVKPVVKHLDDAYNDRNLTLEEFVIEIPDEDVEDMDEIMLNKTVIEVLKQMNPKILSVRYCILDTYLN